jgi:hypothetical protein
MAFGLVPKHAVDGSAVGFAEYSKSFGIVTGSHQTNKLSVSLLGNFLCGHDGVVAPLYTVRVWIRRGDLKGRKLPNGEIRVDRANVRAPEFVHVGPFAEAQQPEEVTQMRLRMLARDSVGQGISSWIIHISENLPRLG